MSSLARGRFLRSRYLTLAALSFLLGPVAICTVLAQERQKEPSTPGPMLEQGYLDLDTSAFSLRLVRFSQTVAVLKSKGVGEFDFTPSDLLVKRSKDGYYHLGDIDLRLRAGTSNKWKNYSTALAHKPVAAHSSLAPTLAAADLAPTLPEDI